ncbi:hypothetical protein EOI86_12485 [Hwanghaeella grinnelliae]|uniref:AsmA family protein n=1 Tax=Hwanghaeella grinnelliae TaxID=2500179 RepID=A0A437QQV8_9PROT|nr:hypothetical protein EOI86_12485 [Hwanghaeella grinnelliae]
MKKIGIALVVLIVLIGGGVYYFLSNLDEFVRTAVEKAGTRATGVEVTLGKVALDIAGGKGSLGDLNVANPSGFDTDYAFNLGDISVSLDLDSLQSNPIVINEVIVTSPKVIYELGDGGSNIDAIQRNVENFTKEISGGASSSDEAGGDGTKVVINDLYIRGADVRVSAPFLKGQAMGTEVPEIHLQDIGKDSGGATPGEVAAQVLDSLTSRVQGVVSNLNLDELRDAATKAVEGAAGEATKALEGAGGSAGGALEGATEGLKGLIGGD